MKIPSKINLASIPTPLQKLNFENKNFLIKRDDLTGVELTGNKVRKLEYLIYEAKKLKADIIFTCGGDQSNHARATAVAAANAGIKSKLFLWGKDSFNADGNLFINKITGADIKFLSKKDYQNVNDIMFEEKAKLSRKGLKVYVIPEGGSTTLGIWGYISFMKELKNQIDLRKISGILTASGSGGTSAGLLAGTALLNLDINIYAVNVAYSKEEIRRKILFLAEGAVLDYNLKCNIPQKNLIILDGYSTEGYKNISDDKLKLIVKFAQRSGIILDPAYTGKAFTAYYENFISTNKGMQNIFVHTGGLFGAFSKRKEYLSNC